MSFPEPFPEDILDEIREYPGNDKCCDCPSIDTDWASVSHGTLICLDCAGKHRSLGVHVSFVRSITMDTWSRQQVEMMRQGGNGQIRRFFKKLEIDNSPIHILYCTKGAEHYRDKLKERVEKIMTGEIKSEKRLLKKKSFTEEKSISSSASSVEIPTFDATFGEGPLGLTLTKDFKERACVSKLVPGGAAQLAGVLVGDFIVGVAGKKLSNYDEIMHMIPCMGRPLTLKFGRQPTPKSSRTSQPSATSTHEHIHPSRSEPHLPSSAARSPDASIHKEHQQSATPGIRAAPPSSVKTSTSTEALQGKEPKRESTPRVSPRVAVRSHKKQKFDDESSDEEVLNMGYKATIKKAAPTGSNDSLSRLEQSSDNRGTPSKNPRTTSHTSLETINHYSATGVRLTQSEKVIRTKTLLDEVDEKHPSKSSEITHDLTENDIGEDVDDENYIDNDSEEDGEDDDDDEDDDNDYDCEEQDESDEEEEDDENDYTKDEIDHDSEGYNDIEDSYQEDDQNLIGGLVEEATDYGNFVQEDDVQDSESSGPYAPGSVVKVLRESDSRWKTAVIHRLHKDGSFKVIYSNGTKESHVHISRIATNAVVLGPTVSTSSASILVQNSKYQEAVSSITFDKYETTNDGNDVEFKVDANEDLDAWIEKDLASELSSIDVQYEDSYFLKKTVLAPPLRSTPSTSFAKTEVETATYKEFSVTFEQAPLGLTLSANKTKEPSVIRIKVEGNAQLAGVAVGDVLLQIDQYPVSEYDEAMRILPGCIYPLTLRFRRGTRNLVLESGEAIMKSSRLVANKLMDTMGLNNKTSILDQPTQVRASSSSSKQSVSITTVAPSAPKPRFLPPTPGEGEFDIVFEQGELGFRLDERAGITVVSVVTEITEKGQAQQKGLKMGCILVGINRDPFLSHAHAVATLKHAKRPLSVRFRNRNYS